MQKETIYTTVFALLLVALLFALESPRLWGISFEVSVALALAVGSLLLGVTWLLCESLAPPELLVARPAADPRVRPVATPPAFALSRNLTVDRENFLFRLMGLDTMSFGRVYRILARFALCDGRIDPAERGVLKALSKRHLITVRQTALFEAQSLRLDRFPIGPDAREQALLRSELDQLKLAKGPLSLVESRFVERLLAALVGADRTPPVVMGPRLRCAYCHDALESNAVGCGGCGTVVHRDCLAELAGCPTPGCGRPLWSPRVVAREPRPETANDGVSCASQRDASQRALA